MTLYPNNKYDNADLGGFDYLHRHQPKPFNPAFDRRAPEWWRKASEAIAKMEPFPNKAARVAAWKKEYERIKESDK